jgi:hypothetical protein
VRHARRQVQRIAGFEYPVVRRREFAQQLQFGIVAEIFWRAWIYADPPAPPAHTLHEEHVVLIDVCADAAAVGRVTHHHIVHAPTRD